MAETPCCSAAVPHGSQRESTPSPPASQFVSESWGATFVSAEFFLSVKKKKKEKKKRVYCDLWTSHSSDPARLDITSHCCNVFACSLWRLTRLSACFKFKFATLVLNWYSYWAKGTENKDIWFPYYLLVLIKSRSLVVLLKVTFILFYSFLTSHKYPCVKVVFYHLFSKTIIKIDPLLTDSRRCARIVTDISRICRFMMKNTVIYIKCHIKFGPGGKPSISWTFKEVFSFQTPDWSVYGLGLDFFPWAAPMSLK